MPCRRRGQFRLIGRAFEMTKADVLMNMILSRAEGRYVADLASEDVHELRSLAAASLEAAVCRLRRNDKASWRTILLACVPYSEEAVRTTYSWAAEVRERLPGTQSADLYLMALMDEVPDAEGLKIETDDNFCRKYVLRVGENPADFIDRTFLGHVKAESEAGPLQNPVVTALQTMAKSHPWADSLIDSWEQVLIHSDANEVTKLLMGLAAGDQARD